MCETTKLVWLGALADYLNSLLERLFFVTVGKKKYADMSTVRKHDIGVPIDELLQARAFELSSL
jgi:hypothetical protein